MKKITFILLFFFGFVSFVSAANQNEIANFNIDAGYDISGRNQLTAVLTMTSPKIYFYADRNWWDLQGFSKQNEILNNLNLLSTEFDSKIYPVLTSVFGFEWKPGVDGDERITVLIHPMKEEIGGYFRTLDEYLKLQNPESNEREMIYISADRVVSHRLKEFLAHEFMHLITFNQKERILGVSEETWLNEARAEYVSTLLGYDNVYEGSNLQRRVLAFLESPSDSITEWRVKKADYGAVNIFTQYLVDRYGIGVLSDSIKSKKTGILSINEALLKNGFKENFSQIFTDWTIAVLVNDCSLGEKYCYLNKNLNNLKIKPNLNFLPFSGNSTLSVADVIKDWSGNWQKFIGGKGKLVLEFNVLAGLNFKVPYLTQKENGDYSLYFLGIGKNQKGKISISDFGGETKSLIILPSLQNKISGFDGVESTYSYSFSVSVFEENSNQDLELERKLLSQIESLKSQIAKIQNQINILFGKKPGGFSCLKLENNLYFGLVNNKEVSCLQEFLSAHGPEIYPEGLVSGNFYSLTQKAVIRFQEKYASEILLPASLQKGTGYVGFYTRMKINELLTFF